MLERKILRHRSKTMRQRVKQSERGKDRRLNYAVTQPTEKMLGDMLYEKIKPIQLPSSTLNMASKTTTSSVVSS